MTCGLRETVTSFVSDKNECCVSGISESRNVHKLTEKYLAEKFSFLDDFVSSLEDD